jgi:SanA protein
VKRKLIIILSIVVATIVVAIIVCNIIVLHISNGKCYDDIDAIPHRTFGLLLGTGRSSAPSPYYDARIQAAIDLYHAGKIDAVIISGENLYDDYYEVDTMVVTLKELGVPIKMVDPYGTDTYTSLRRIGGFGEYLNSMTIISQHFHNLRAVYYGSFLYEETPIAYHAKDTNIWYWDIWRLCRESLARTKAVLMSLCL